MYEFRSLNHRLGVMKPVLSLRPVVLSLRPVVLSLRPVHLSPSALEG